MHVQTNFASSWLIFYTGPLWIFTMSVLTCQNFRHVLRSSYHIFGCLVTNHGLFEKWRLTLFAPPPRRVYVALVGRPAQRSGKINLAYQPAHRRTYENNKNTKTHSFLSRRQWWCCEVAHASVFPPSNNISFLSIRTILLNTISITVDIWINPGRFRCNKFHFKSCRNRFVSSDFRPAFTSDSTDWIFKREPPFFQERHRYNSQRYHFHNPIKSLLKSRFFCYRSFINNKAITIIEVSRLFQRHSPFSS